jgi:N,N-dimethylformamidase
MASSERFPSWALGYADEFSVRPGRSLTFRVSGAGAETVEAQLVRLIHGDTQPAGPGFREVEIDSDVNGHYPLVEQESHFGSYGRIPGALTVLPPSESPASLVAMIQPALCDHQQPVMSAWDETGGSGIALILEPGLRLAVWMYTEAGRQRIVADEPLVAGVWYAVCGAWDPQDETVAVRAVPAVNSYNSQFGPTTVLRAVHHAATAAAPRAWPGRDLLLGAMDAADGGVTRGKFNGKMGLPCVYASALSEAEVIATAASGAAPLVSSGLRAWWDLSQAIDGFAIAGGNEISPDGEFVNAPTRGVTGHNWDGSCYEWRHCPSMYGAVHFHDDDVEDVGWRETCTLTVPDDLRSGVYALRLRAGSHEDHVPFFVTAPAGREESIALVLPTASYIAYANEHDATREMVQGPVGHTPTLQPMDLLLMEHPDLGLSMYDHHSDGSGVALSSRRRPIVNMRPRHRFSLLGTWQFPSDLYIVDWLEQRGYRYDVLTDEDLHVRGAEALRPYRVAITGTHPEYTSEAMLNAYQDFVVGGGNVMYVGGNGFYWVVTFHPERPWLMELRRGENGVRAWAGAPGETTHSMTGEKGGLWRDRGRPPQKLFGVGFTSEGYGGSFYYHRLPDADEPDLAWVFDGVDGAERIGDFGLVGGGASGQELDRADVTLGTPYHAYLLASAQDQNDSYKIVPEDSGAITEPVGGTEHPNVRADMTIYEAAGGGSVFATSSIAWAGSLSHSDYDNDISRITANVLDRFSADRGP